MEVKYLCYVGNKKEGSLVVKIVHANSPFRNLKYQKGMRWKIGVEIPGSVAEFLSSDYKTLFKIESEELSVDNAFKEELLKLIDDCEEHLSSDEIGKLISEILKEKGYVKKETSKRKLGRK